MMDFHGVMIAELSKALRSGHSPPLRVWVHVPLLTKNFQIKPWALYRDREK